MANASNTAVTWSASGGTIDPQSGLFTAPSAYGNYTVTATSVEDSTATDTAQVVVSSGTGTDAVFTYDLNGNMTGDGTRTFEWDAENRLVAVVKGTHRSEFGYDGFGHRVDIRELDADANGNWVTSVDTKYVWEGTTILESRNADGSITLQRYYAQGFMDSDGTALYYTRDHLGSTRELVDALGAIRARYDYAPYGRMTKIQGDKDSRFLYTGHLWHAASGLYLTPFRVYDPNQGRWLSRDDSEATDGYNLYKYVQNSPISAFDPLGLATVYVWDYQGSLDGWGHASIQLDDGTHISFWPTDQNLKGSDGMPFAADPNPNESFLDDQKGEGNGKPKPPDHTYCVKGLDEKAIKEWWEKYKKSHQWKAGSTNCSFTVAEALKAGGFPVDNFLHDVHPVGIWTPNDVNDMMQWYQGGMQRPVQWGWGAWHAGM